MNYNKWCDHVLNPKIWLIVKVSLLIVSIYFFHSAFLTLNRYSANAPNIKLTEEDVFIRGEPVINVFYSLVIGGLMTLISCFIAVFEYCLTTFIKQRRVDSKT